MMKNFIKKSLINNKFYKLNIQLKDNQIIFKIDELSLSVNIDYKYENRNFDTIIISNKFYGLVNSIKFNKKSINYNQKQDEERQFIHLNSINNQYAVVEHKKCPIERLVAKIIDYFRIFSIHVRTDKQLSSSLTASS
jgi:hypothetical protein